MSLNQQEASIVFEESLYQIEGKVLVVLAEPWSDLTEQEVTLLSKILVSVGHDLAGVTVLNSPVDLNEVVETFAPSAIIAFDSKLAKKADLYQATKIDNTSVLLADSLSKLSEDKKKVLWEALKQIFRR